MEGRGVGLWRGGGWNETPGMSKWIVIGVAAVAVIGAFVLGLVVQRQVQVLSLRAAGQVARDFAGLDDPVAPAPPWEAWGYPGASTRASRQTLAVRVEGRLVRPAGRYAVLVTRDDFEKVAEHYAVKAGFEDAPAVAASRSAAANSDSLQGESTVLLDDFVDARGSDAARPVRVKALLRRSPSYDLTVVLTRAAEESATHILVLYDPKMEPAGVVGGGGRGAGSQVIGTRRMEPSGWPQRRGFRIS